MPEDDGGAAHLPGLEIPGLKLVAPGGDEIDLAAAARETLVLYVYPRTGTPGQPLRPGWSETPGARGCTVQNLAFRHRHSELLAIGAAVLGLTAQPPAEVREFAAREQMPYPLLSDSELEMAGAIGLPTFEFEGARLYKRLTLIAREGRIAEVIYPVFPPGSDADRALELLRGG